MSARWLYLHILERLPVNWSNGDKFIECDVFTVWTRHSELITGSGLWWVHCDEFVECDELTEEPAVILHRKWKKISLLHMWWHRNGILMTSVWRVNCDEFTACDEFTVNLSVCDKIAVINSLSVTSSPFDDFSVWQVHHLESPLVASWK